VYAEHHMGRKESIVWPTNSDLCLQRGVPFRRADFLLCLRLDSLATTPLQRYYLPLYERTSVIGAFSKTHGATIACSCCGPRTLATACSER